MTDVSPIQGLTPGVMLTVETILATQEHFADLAERCIACATESATPGPDQFRISDLAGFLAWQRDLAGEFDHGLTHRQWGHWRQTGESVPLLPRTTPPHTPTHKETRRWPRSR